MDSIDSKALLSYARGITNLNMYYIALVVMTFNAIGFGVNGFINADSGAFAMSIISLVLAGLCVVAISLRKDRKSVV